MDTSFHSKSVRQTLEELGADLENGLGSGEACSRLERLGPNRLQGAKKKPLVLRILAQFKDFLVIILIAAAAVSVIAGDGLKDAILIVGILLVNVIISITQENRADNALAKLKDMSSPKAKVRRDGQIVKISSDEVVPGDVVLLDAGDYVPADLRIAESVNLKIDEAALTGESMPVTKNAAAVLDAGAGLGDRVNLASMGTVVTYGRGTGVACATGMKTEMGKIAAILNETAEANTPLQDKLNAMAKMLGIVCVATCALIFGIGFLRGMPLMEMFMVSVALAVAAVPEGVAIVATVILAIGVQKMVRSNVIVKKLRAVETLGSTTVICSDKTGTLTQNKMTVVKAFDTDRVYEVTGTGYGAEGEVVSGGLPASGNIALMSEIAVLCNDAVYNRAESKVIGDPTEAAMLVFGAKNGHDKDEMAARYRRVQEIPFDSDRKLMSTYNLKNGRTVMNTKGAPDAIIRRSSKAYIDGEIVPMTGEIRERLARRNEGFAAAALRVLAFAYKECGGEPVPGPKSEAETEAEIKAAIEADGREEELVYVGMMCMQDPPREEARAAVAECRGAGISVKMITGDHKTTAAAIAESLGILEAGGETLDGGELDGLSDGELAEKARRVSVFARVSPEHKVRIVAAVKAGGNIVAMTGDGVNDAPSLKKADIGIAMGIAGTDVSKEAADMILTDDNFVSIVGAVEQGRTIYGNIRKVTGYLLSCNIGEIMILLLAILFGLPVPLVATQLLFVNLLTDAFPAFALGMEGKEPGTMKKPPRDPGEPIINRGMRGSVAARALSLCAGCLGAFLFGLHFHGYEVAISMCFFTLVAGELLVSYSAKSESLSVFGGAMFANRFLNVSMSLSLGVLAAVMYVPFLNELFSTVPLSPAQLAVCLACVAAAIAGSELSKTLLGAGKAKAETKAAA